MLENSKLPHPFNSLKLIFAPSFRTFIVQLIAEMVELADTLALGASARKALRVRVPSPAQRLYFSRIYAVTIDISYFGVQIVTTFNGNEQ